MPFVFQALVNDVLRDMLNKYVFVYLDDILIFSHNCEDHLTHVQTVHSKYWIKSPKSTIAASFEAAQDIVRHGKPFTDSEYMKESFIKISEHPFSDFKNKTEIVQKIKDMPLSAKTVKDRAIKMATNNTSQQIEDITSVDSSQATEYIGAELNDIEQTSLLCA